MNLPATAQDFIAGARKNRRPAQTSGDTAFLKFSGKDGSWSLGKDEVPVEGEQLIVNSLSLAHGYVRWGEKPPARTFITIAKELPEPPEPFDGVDDNGAPKTFYPQDARCFGGKFVDEDLGDFSFECNSMGGRERTDELYDAILDRAEESEYFFPLVELGNDFYKRSTGKVFKPIFRIVGWANQDGEPEPKEEPKKIEQEEEQPARRRRRR